ncbi:universal stress protein [Brevibacillus ginsengisoli]|uniref:universal stress protein n=1 Tax=Brevibacillus ginsengisoli TaxID=363854 RepID=UPI003CE87A51
MKKVLLAYDGSESAEAAVHQLLELGKQISQLQIGIITVIPDSDKSILEQVPSYAEWQARLFTKAENEIKQVCAQFEAEGLHAEGIVRIGSPAVTIIEEANQNHYDTIMLGHREHNLGSVSMKIVALSPVGVYITS